MVAEQLNISRGTLDKRFKKLLGYTVDQEIRRVRLARAQELLVRTSLSIREVAARAGYGNEQYLITVMRTGTGTTPARYRRDHRHANPNLPERCFPLP
jgi:transcriptional regulator GlxA family with amidase domain